MRLPSCIPQDIDRFENEGGPGAEDTRQQRPDAALVVPMEAAQLDLPQPIAGPKCGGEEIPMDEASGAVDPNQVIVTAGATAHSSQAHHPGFPELRSSRRIARVGRRESGPGPGSRDRRRRGRTAPRAARAGSRRCQGFHCAKHLIVPSSGRDVGAILRLPAAGRRSASSVRLGPSRSQDAGILRAGGHEVTSRGLNRTWPYSESDLKIHEIHQDRDRRTCDVRRVACHSRLNVCQGRRTSLGGRDRLCRHHREILRWKPRK